MHIKSVLLGDTELLAIWLMLFQEESSISLSRLYDNSAVKNEVKSVVESSCENTVVIKDLFNEVVTSYVRVGDSQFRKDFLHKIEREKSVSHRQKILKRKKKVFYHLLK